MQPDQIASARSFLSKGTVLTQELDEHTPVYFTDNQLEGGVAEEEIKDNSAVMQSMLMSPRESQSELVNGMNSFF